MECDGPKEGVYDGHSAPCLMAAHPAVSDSRKRFLGPTFFVPRWTKIPQFSDNFLSPLSNAILFPLDLRQAATTTFLLPSSPAVPKKERVSERVRGSRHLNGVRLRLSDVKTSQLCLRRTRALCTPCVFLSFVPVALSRSSNSFSIMSL